MFVFARIVIWLLYCCICLHCCWFSIDLFCVYCSRSMLILEKNVLKPHPVKHHMEAVGFGSLVFNFLCTFMFWICTNLPSACNYQLFCSHQSAFNILHFGPHTPLHCAWHKAYIITGNYYVNPVTLPNNGKTL